MKTSNKNSAILQLAIIGLLIAVGTIIPIVMPFFPPFRIVIPPASYTLGVHIPIFIAMFISPKAAIAVTIGTTAGFFLAGFPVTIVLRAASHILFALPGAIYLAKASASKLTGLNLRLFSLVIAAIHGISEAVIVIVFFLGTSFPEGQGIWWIFGFVGFGSVVHSLIDFELANIIRRPLSRWI
ncbi:MAG: hypothetical protein FWB98_08690 [Defluviitaleaceae bacterium]|nr:hypothetical protein [Defluviitaleaceae bacterium]